MARLINRYSCKCKLCKAKWTTEAGYSAAWLEHIKTCPRYLEISMKRYPKSPEETRQWMMKNLFFSYIQIRGTVNNEIKCDGRCMGATGHNCECSCGGQNHGVGAAA